MLPAFGIVDGLPVSPTAVGRCELVGDDLSGGAIYSVPHSLIDDRVWARTHGSESR